MGGRIVIPGAGFVPAVRTLPRLLSLPSIAYLVSDVLSRQCEPDNLPNALKLLVELPWYARTGVSLLFLLAGRAVLKHQARRWDRKRYGPDVLDVPYFKTWWPWNLSFIPFILDSMENGYSAEGWIYFLDEYNNTVNLNLLGGDLIITSEPESIRHMLSADYASYEKGQAFRDKVFSALGNGLFNSDGETWKFHRNMTRPFFSRDRISQFDTLAHNSDKAIAKLLSRFEERSEDGKPIATDFQDLVQHFTLDSSAEFLFGSSTQSLDTTLPYPHTSRSDNANSAFAEAFRRIQEDILTRFSLDILWPWFELWSDRTRENMSVIDSFIVPIMDERIKEKQQKKGESSDEDRLTLLDDLIHKGASRKVIKDQMVNILVAGRDSTSGTLSFAVYLLATDPGALAKLRAEILKHVGPTDYPTAQHFKEMKYLRAVLDETLRFFPPLPINERTAIRSTVLKSSGGKSFYIPVGTNLNFSVMHMHRRKDLWGPDADEFDPDRWLDERYKKYVGSNPFIFLPFSTGPRNCLGQQFAYNTMSFFLVRLLQKFEAITLVPEAQPIGTLPPPEWKGAPGRKGFEKIWPSYHLTQSCKGGLWVHMTPVKVVE
ncbi:cytochrome P450 family protein [Ceratobasidium sp. AG-Ba]|nr:cytochrome P450 family protein [Ceratobasidium sp. AG-Ba]